MPGATTTTIHGYLPFTVVRTPSFDLSQGADSLLIEPGHQRLREGPRSSREIGRIRDPRPTERRGADPEACRTANEIGRELALQNDMTRICRCYEFEEARQF